VLFILHIADQMVTCSPRPEQFKRQRGIVSDHAIILVKVLDPFPRAVLNWCAIDEEACAVSMSVGEVLDNCIRPEMWEKTQQSYTM
jgi:hypothetical protein